MTSTSLQSLDKMSEGNELIQFYKKTFASSNKDYNWEFFPNQYHPIYKDMNINREKFKNSDYFKFHIMAKEKKDQTNYPDYTKYYFHVSVGNTSYGQDSNGNDFRTKEGNYGEIARELYQYFRRHMKTAKKNNEIDGIDEKKRLARIKRFQGGKTRKHRGIIQTGGNKGRLRKGYRYSGKRLKSGLPQIIKCKKR
jgi:hypothetical protein